MMRVTLAPRNYSYNFFGWREITIERETGSNSLLLFSEEKLSIYLS